MLMSDVEDDVDVPGDAERRVCTETGETWAVSRTCRICPGCGQPLLWPNNTELE
jgi:hypothetical protein